MKKPFLILISLLLFSFLINISCNPESNVSQNPIPVDTTGNDLENTKLLFTSQIGSYGMTQYILNINGETGTLVKEHNISRSIFGYIYSFYNDNNIYLAKSDRIYDDSTGDYVVIDSVFNYDINNGNITFYKSHIASYLIYDGNNTYLDSSGTLTCINTITNTQIWKNKISIYSPISIFYDTQNIYFKGYDTLYCLNKTNGSTIWKKRIAGIPEFSIYNNHIMYHSSNTLNCIDKRDGSIIWQKFSLAQIYDPINIYTNKSIISNTNNEISLINTDNGNVLWTKTTDSKYLQTYSIDNQYCYFLTDSFKVVKRNISDGEIALVSEKFDNNFFTYPGGISGYLRFSMLGTDSTIIFNTVNKIFAIKKNNFNLIWQYNANESIIDSIQGFEINAKLQLHSSNKIIYSEPQL
ncbi:MAG: PQQ-like beta-propeller repeat protein [Sphingobacteriales bacterium]|jgi:hypothetical protein|nr:MAG: PQQ-like beta-propeller repeat protein [Sphingobacteriales bacterium]